MGIVRELSTTSAHRLMANVKIMYGTLSRGSGATSILLFL